MYVLYNIVQANSVCKRDTLQITHLLLMLLDDWKQRHAALNTISALGYGCEKQITAMLEELLDMILPFCQDKVTLVFCQTIVNYCHILASSSDICYLHCYWTITIV